MKKFFFTIALLATAVLAISSLYAAPDEESSETITREYFEGEKISKLTISSAFQVKLVKSEQTRVVLEVSADMEKYIQLSCNNGELRASMKDTDEDDGFVNTLRKIFKDENNRHSLTIYTPYVERIKLSGATRLRSEDTFDAKSVSIEISGASSTDMTFEADRLTVKASGASNVVLKGKGGDVTLNISGASNIKMDGYKAESVELSASGASDVDVFASGTISISASGASSVRYAGDAKVVKHKSSGASKIIEL